MPNVNGTGDNLAIPAKFPLILAADSLYSPDHPRMLVDTIAAWLSPDNDARVIIEFPYRDCYLPEIKGFRRQMLELGLEILEGIGLQIVQEGEENGFDDWGASGASEGEEDRALVTCWWSCWKRQISRAS